MAGKRILVADDDHRALDSLVKRLKELDYEVMAFSNGSEAIENSRIFSPDLLILDILMPDVDGYSVVRAIREDKNLENVPVIFITAQDLEHTFMQKRVTEIGSCDFMNKFRSFDELLAKIREKIGS